MTAASISNNPPQECDEDMKVVVVPVFQGRLEESSERTRRSYSNGNWGFYQLFSSTMNGGSIAGVANNPSSRDIVLILIYVLIGIVIFISILLIIRMLLGMASTASSSSQRKVKVNSQSQG